MNRRTRRRRGQPGVESAPLRVLRPLLVEPPASQSEQLLAALRVLFQDALEERLAFRGEESVDPDAMRGDGFK